MQIPKDLSLKEKTFGIAPYMIEQNSGLQKAIEYAHLLKRPLLLRGEPGCGKTQFARVLAYQLYGENYKDKYFEWFVKSTSKANDGLYTFDYLKRLHDAQFIKIGKNNEELDDENYLSMGPMGEAFEKSKKDEPTILLIDEIDKADIDFPNDLLLELDQKRFTIPELGNKEIKAEEPPIVIITSNDERELPNAFLRRCVFCYINFPENKTLEKIVASHLTSYVEKDKGFSEKYIESIVGKFREIYDKMKADGNKDKTVSTSELLDWTKVIYNKYLDEKISDDDLKKLLTTTFEDGKETINYPEVLFKTLNDFNLFRYQKR